ncbi:MAG: hypothetical protein LUD00_09575 [Prevotellaceae bacterium]|nr:hypothetical protein [Prevotellaceae bacterium]
MKRILSLLSLMYSVCIMAQMVTPEPFKYYQIVNANGLAFTRVEAEDNKPLQQVPDVEDERQAFEFVSVQGEEGKYMIKSAVDNTWVCKITVDWDWDWWSIVFQEKLPVVITKAKYEIEAIAGTEYIAIKNLHSQKYWGVDDGGEGTGIHCDKGLDRNSYWKLVELPTPLLKVYEKSYAQLDVLFDKLEGFRASSGM